MTEELAHLNQLIALGAEYPDAVYATTVAYGCSADLLQEAYDQQHPK